MAKITLKGNTIETFGDLPSVGQIAPNFELVKTDLSEVNLKEYKGKKIVLNIFPSLDTDVCALSVAKFNSEVEKLDNTVILCISADLPFAHGRFCSTNGYNNIITLSNFRDDNFGKDYGVEIITGPLKGILSRAIVVINEEGNVVYTEQVPEIVHEPDYDKALEHLK